MLLTWWQKPRPEDLQNASIRHPCDYYGCTDFIILERYGYLSFKCLENRNLAKEVTIVKGVVMGVCGLSMVSSGAELK